MNYVRVLCDCGNKNNLQKVKVDENDLGLKKFKYYCPKCLKALTGKQPFSKSFNSRNKLKERR